jgi:hydroxymethylpyrimidine/phosphomethylpyrimidine kinase / thiaminase
VFHPLSQVRYSATVPAGLLYSFPSPHRQDYLYLKYYARANGYGSFPSRKLSQIQSCVLNICDFYLHSLLVAKSSTYAEFAAAAGVVLSIVKEHNMHISFCAQWGVDLAELESTPESAACTAYGAYIMDVGMKGALRDLRFIN